MIRERGEREDGVSDKRERVIKERKKASEWVIMRE